MPVDRLGRDLVEGARRVDAGIVDEDVDAAELVLGLGEELGDVRGLRHIRLHGHRRSTGGLDLRHQSLRRICAFRVIDDDLGAVRRQPRRDPRPDPLRGAGDHRDLTAEIAHVMCPYYTDRYDMGRPERGASLS